MSDAKLHFVSLCNNNATKWVSFSWIALPLLSTAHNVVRTDILLQLESMIHFYSILQRVKEISVPNWVSYRGDSSLGVKFIHHHILDICVTDGGSVLRSNYICLRASNDVMTYVACQGVTGRLMFHSHSVFSLSPLGD